MMLCQECGQRQATLHFTKIVNGDKNEYHICEVCAKERGEKIPGTPNSFSIHNLLSGLLNMDSAGSDHSRFGQQPALQCDHCGLTYEQFTRIGRFGCSECYHAFEPKLEPVFRRIHGTTTHEGKLPRRTGGQIKVRKELSSLKEALQQAILSEEFEKAAQLRDQIRELEKGIS